MMLKEFSERTGIHPTITLYTFIENEYMSNDEDKDTFCRNYKENKDGIAEKVARDCFLAVQELLRRKDEEISLLENKVKKLEKQLEQEKGWMPYTDRNVSDEDYNKFIFLCAPLWNEDDLKDYLCKTYGFRKELIQVVNDVPVYEISRNRQLRKTGTKPRRAMYISTDYNYARFDCCGMSWELHNGELKAYD